MGPGARVSNAAVAVTAASPGGRDARITCLLLAGLLAWDLSGADLPIARLFASAHGFASRDSLWASTLVHGGGRWLAWSMAAALVVAAMRASSRTGGQPTRRDRFGWLAVMLLCAIAIPAMKQLSTTSCPWDLAEFGGRARYLSHWAWGLADNGNGHCFPAGHAAAAFAFIGMYFLWRRHDGARARAWLFGVLAVGTLFGVGQLVRGAHYPSHTLWTAWICWSICAGADWVRRTAALRRLARASVSTSPAGPGGPPPC